MAKLPYDFDASQVDPSSSMAADPNFTGWHKMIFGESEMKPTKDNTGQYLQLVADVIEGPYKGRKLWARLNLVNKSQQAVDIAYRELSAICHATGCMNVTDSQQLHNRPFLGNVEFEPQKGEYKAKNNLVGYKPAGAGPAATQAAPVTGTPAPSKQAEEAAAVPPWQRKAS